MRLALAVLLLLSVVSCAGSIPRERVPNASEERRPVQRFVVRPQRSIMMSDSLYAALSAMPIDSLSVRQYALLVEERRHRTTNDTISHVVAVYVGVALMVTVGLLLAAANSAP